MILFSRHHCEPDLSRVKAFRLQKPALEYHFNFGGLREFLKGDEAKEDNNVSFYYLSDKDLPLFNIVCFLRRTGGASLLGSRLMTR